MSPKSCISERAKTLCGMCLKEVNVGVKCAWDYSENCLAGRLQKLATAFKNGVKVVGEK